jgi:hypothetical protein
MHEDALVDAHRHQDQQSEHDRRYWRAFHLLRDDFMRALDKGARAEVSTPHDPVGETTPLVNVVLEMVETDEDNVILAGLLECLVRASHAGDTDALLLVDRIAMGHASYFTTQMSEAGDLHE